jgi:hypothetical protein
MVGGLVGTRQGEHVTLGRSYRNGALVILSTPVRHARHALHAIEWHLFDEIEICGVSELLAIATG